MSNNLLEQQIIKLLRENPQKVLNAMPPNMFKFMTEQFETDIPTKYLLNVEGTQFPLSKTYKQLQVIELTNVAKLHYLHSSTTNEHHVISIIISSNNLAETAQWHARTEKRFGKKLKICVVSSKTSNDKMGSGRGINNFIHACSLLKEKDLPNILLMCCHSKRIGDDVMDLLHCCDRWVLENGRRFKFNIFIDEADKNINLVSKTIKWIKKADLEKHVPEMHFITATPSPKFWRTLKSCGIKSLYNLDLYYPDLKISQEERKKITEGYRSILNQEITPYLNMTPDPLEYIIKVMDNIIDVKKRRIIFCPGGREVQTHWAISKYFQDRKWWSFVHNGGFKGFVSPSGEEITVIDFKKKYNMPIKKTELRDVFRIWNRNNPTANLAITGLTTIVRGLTFNTNGFNFTDMIFSAVHGNNLADFIQVLGRCCGNKKYCKSINIIGIESLYKKAQLFVKNILEIKEEDIEEYKEEDFKLNNKNKGIFTEEKTDPLKAYTHVRMVLGENKRPLSEYQIKNSSGLVIGFDFEKYPKNEKGFYKNNLRGEEDVMSVEYIKNNRGWGINDKKSYRIHAGYKDVEDINTLTWVICYEKSYYDEWIKINKESFEKVPEKRKIRKIKKLKKEALKNMFQK